MSKPKGSAIGVIAEKGERLGFVEMGMRLILGTEWTETDWFSPPSEQDAATAFKNHDSEKLRRFANWVAIEAKTEKAAKRHAEGVVVVDEEVDGFPQTCADLSEERVELIRAFHGYDLANGDAQLRYECELTLEQKAFNELVLDIAHILLRQVQRGTHPVYAAMLLFLRKIRTVDLSVEPCLNARYLSVFGAPRDSWLNRFLELFEQVTEPVKLTSNEVAVRLSRLLGSGPDPKTVREAAGLLRIELASPKRGKKH
jgi:hypothetical protein